MFLCARNVKAEDGDTMVRLCYPSLQDDPIAQANVMRQWERLWRAGVPQGILMEDLQPDGPPRSVGLLVVAFVPPEIHDGIIRADGPPLLDGLAEAVEAGGLTAADDAVVGAANAGEGLDVVVCWTGYVVDGLSAEDATSLRSRVITAFSELFAGHRIRQFTIETNYEPVRQRFEAYGLHPIRDTRGAIVLTIGREEALSRSDVWTQRFFSYHPPVLGFSPAQRSILLLARQGFTDQEIATALGRTTDSVKKRWSGIYARFAAAFPGRLPVSGDGSRGQEKRRTLLAYLKDRPEELRPYGKVEHDG